ncbi:MAG TPA: GNAT family N-acetyltransferase [bacterium]|nr:GNAT family N-acetyltransferase [bacterium]
MAVPEFTVRYLGPGEAAAWAAVPPDPGRDTTPITNRLIPLLHDPARDAAEFVVAEADGGRLLGKLRADFRPGGEAQVYAPLVPDPGHVEEVGRSLLARFLSECWARQIKRITGVQLLGPGLGDPEAVAALFTAMGFTPLQERHIVWLDLKGWSPGADPDALQYRTLHEIGNLAFLEVMREVAGAPTSPAALPAAPEEDFLAMRLAAEPIFDPELWQVGYHKGAPVGCVMAQPTPADPTIGDLYCCGVVPGLRRQGFGQLLFERGLSLLKGHWVMAFQGAADPGNVPWLKLLGAAGAEVVERQRLYAGPPLE